MPNYCNNNLVLKHADCSMIERAKKAFEAGNLFKEFVPYEGDWDYLWCCANWSTKWDVGTLNDHIVSVDTNEISFKFDTAYVPPVKVYVKLRSLGFDVKASFFESTEFFAGTWVNGRRRDWSRCDGNIDDVPKHLVETYQMEDFEEDIDEDFDEDADD